MSQFVSILDRLDSFEENIAATRQRLIAMVEQKCDQLLGAVNEVRIRVLKHQSGLPSSQLANEWPEPVGVTFDDYKAAREAGIDDPVDAISDILQPSTSGNKRKRSLSRPVTKRTKTSTSGTVRTKKFACKFQACDRSFLWDAHLKRHERIHLNIEPFRCIWPDCNHADKQKQNLVKHVRAKHFKLPETVKEQKQRGIVDQRNPDDFIEVDQEQLARRLQ